MRAPKRYRKKQVEVEAVQWDGTNSHQHEIVNWSGGAVAGMFDAGDLVVREPHPTTDGYSIFFVCKRDIFHATYEPVEEGQGTVRVFGEEDGGFSEVRFAISQLIEAANPGQTLVIERHHIDRDGKYFTVTTKPYETQVQARVEECETCGGAREIGEEIGSAGERWEPCPDCTQPASVALAPLTDEDRERLRSIAGQIQLAVGVYDIHPELPEQDIQFLRSLANRQPEPVEPESISSVLADQANALALEGEPVEEGGGEGFTA